MEGVSQRLQRLLSHFGFQLALPHSDAMPPHGGKRALLGDVARLVALNLRLPIIDVALGKNEMAATVMTMPKTTIDEDYGAVFAKHEVGMTGQAGMVQPIAEATTEQELPHQQFRFGVLALYRRHAAMPLFLVHLIHTFFCQ